MEKIDSKSGKKSPILSNMETGKEKIKSKSGNKIASLFKHGNWQEKDRLDVRRRKAALCREIVD